MKIVMTQPIAKISDEEKKTLHDFVVLLDNFCDASTCADCPFGHFCETVRTGPSDVVANILHTIGYGTED